MKRPDSEVGLNRKFMEFIKLLNIYLNHFPKHEKYALSNKIRNTAYELYDYITEGQKRYYKKTTLTNMDITHEKLRMQLYLSYELGYFKFKDGKKSDNAPKQSRFSDMPVSDLFRASVRPRLFFVWGRAEFEFIGFYQPNIEQSSDYLLKGDLSLRYTITDMVGLRLRFQDEYRSILINGRNELISTLSLSIRM